MRATGAVQDVIQQLTSGRRLRIGVIGKQSAAVALLSPSWRRSGRWRSSTAPSKPPTTARRPPPPTSSRRLRQAGSGCRSSARWSAAWKTPSSGRPRRRRYERDRPGSLEPDRRQGVPLPDANLAFAAGADDLHPPARRPGLGDLRGVGQLELEPLRRSFAQLRTGPLPVPGALSDGPARLHHTRAHGGRDQRRARATDDRSSLRDPDPALLDHLGQAPRLDLLRPASAPALGAHLQPRLPLRRHRAGPGRVRVRRDGGDGPDAGHHRHRLLDLAPANPSRDRRRLRRRLRAAGGQPGLRPPLSHHRRPECDDVARSARCHLPRPDPSADHNRYQCAGQRVRRALRERGRGRRGVLLLKHQQWPSDLLQDSPQRVDQRGAHQCDRDSVLRTSPGCDRGNPADRAVQGLAVLAGQRRHAARDLPGRRAVECSPLTRPYGASAGCAERDPRSTERPGIAYPRPQRRRKKSDSFPASVSPLLAEAEGAVERAGGPIAVAPDAQGGEAMVPLDPLGE